MAAATPFAEFITSRRRELDMTLGDVATAMGVSPITISNWSSGAAVPGPDAIVALAELLEVPADDLAAMAGVKVKTPEPAVNLLPRPASEEEPEPATEESTGPIAKLRPAAEAESIGGAEPADTTAAGPAAADAITGTEASAAASPADPDTAADAKAAADANAAPEVTGQAGTAEPQADDPQEDDGASDAVDGEPAGLIEEAGASRPEDKPAVAPSDGEPAAQQRGAGRRPALLRRRAPAEPAASALPLTYIEDPKQLTRYRIRWALTFVVLIVLFFILLWASRELLSALSEVMQAVTPGGIGD